MNLTLNGQFSPDDFHREGKHAKVSQDKVAEITKVNQSTVSRWLCTNNLTTDSNSDIVYFSGYVLKEFVTYLALDAKRISDEVRNHNIKLLSDASDVGFQALIDRMAGITSNSDSLSVVDNYKDALENAMQLVTKMSDTLEGRDSMLLQNQKIIQASFEKISILEEENIRLELAKQINDDVTLKHKLYKSLYHLNALIFAEDYHFPDIDFTVGQILKMFALTSMTETRFANLCSALYWLDYGKKPNEIGVFKYKGKDLIYPSLILFKQENYEWISIKEQFEISYKIKFPTSNRRYLKEIEGVKQQRLLKEMSIKDHLEESKKLGFYKNIE